MRSQAARMALVVVAWIAIGAAGFFVFTSNQRILTAASGLRQVDTHAREAADALVDLRVAQQAYIASGQGVAFWMPKVAATKDTLARALTALRQPLTSAAARTAVDEAAAAAAEFADVDKRARDYIHSGQALMASDVIFTEGGQLISVAARQVETARLTEQQALDTAEAGVRWQEAMAIGGAGALAGLIALVLGLTGSTREAAGADVESVEHAERVGAPARESVSTEADEGIVSHARPSTVPAPSRVPTGHTAVAHPNHARNAIVLKAAADLATDFGRVRDPEELERLLARAADLMDAGGLVVWMGGNGGAGAGRTDDLRPVLAHGYAPNVLARMPVVPRSADNAAAAAYRTGGLQIVLSHPGGPAGAIVAPILGAEGCIGALSAEIKGGGEGSEAVQAVATIVAAHFAGIMAVPPAEADGAAAKVATQ